MNWWAGMCSQTLHFPPSPAGGSGFSAAPGDATFKPALYPLSEEAGMGSVSHVGRARD